jgi:hypothetical protein
VVDLGKEKSPSSEILGIRASSNSLNFIARGGHPKSIWVSLIGRPEETEQVFERRGLRDARHERILLGDSETLHYIQGASRDRRNAPTKRTGKIVELY